ncbi:MAG TPA: nucleotidyltransferase family protein [Chloroflexi bacterium]|nr:nucleotidyltransferase family protein [Chloroflexota bacterium]
MTGTNDSVQTKKDILSLITELHDKLEPFGVKKLGLFGSFARDEQNAESDIDFLVEFEPDQKTFDNFIHLSFFLEDTLKRHVELITPESLSPYIGPQILKEVEYVSFPS